MLRNPKIIRNVFYNIAGLVGLCCVTWLVFAVKYNGTEAISNSQKHRAIQQAYISSDDGQSSMMHGLRGAGNALEQVGGIAIGADLIDSGKCSQRCGSTLSMLDENLELDDDIFRRMAAYANEIAAYFQDNESMRQHYLEMALTTTDGDKRSFLTDIFMRLPYQQKVELSEHYVASEDWRVRADGVMLIADDDTPDMDVANALMGIFSREENTYVKGHILSYLNQGSALQGTTGILHQLDSIIYNGIDTSVRGAALKAKMRLSEQPYHILTDAVHALRTSEPEFQLAGLIAIDQILEHETNYIENGVFINKASIKNDIENIRNLAVYNNDKNRFDHLIRVANTIFLRHFEYQ